MMGGKSKISFAGFSRLTKAPEKDPQTDHAKPPEKLRYKKPRPNTLSLPLPKEASSAPPEMSTATRKRPAEQSSNPSRKAPKQSHNSTPGGPSSQGQEETPPRVRLPRTSETEGQKKVYVQAAKYLLEQFSIPAFRSHATVGIVDRDRIQFYHANRSVILVSSAINFGSKGREDGLDKLIAILIAFDRLSLRESGVLHDLCDTKLFQDNGILSTTRPDPHSEAACIQEGKSLKLGRKDGKKFTVTYGKVISHEPSLVGRSTAVLHATSPDLKGTELVVKISWPGSSRASESEFLEKAIEEAEGTADKWALNHIPKLLFHQDVAFDADSTHGLVASLFEDRKLTNGGYKYERRILRIIVEDRLYPLKSLTDVKEIAQVLLDVACSACSRFLVVGMCSRWISTLVAVREGRHSAPRYQPEQYHVSEGHRREGLRSADGFRSLVVEEDFDYQLQKDFATKNGNTSVYGL
jgi:hypothetical protein